ncbi:MAG: T9SS type A sorting domain-containing protein [Chitinophagaceae bacterium]|jgi:hypothetical protein
MKKKLSQRGILIWRNKPKVLLLALSLFIGQQTFAQSHEFSWVKSIGGSATDLGRNVLTDASDNLYATGYFSGTVDFDPSATALTNLTSIGATDYFLQKSLLKVSSINEQSLYGMTVFPNPANNTLNITLSQALKNGTIMMMNMQGQIVLKKSQIDGHIIELDITLLPPGNYILKAADTNIILKRSIVKSPF